MKYELSGGHLRGREVYSVGLRSLGSRSHGFLPEQAYKIEEIKIQDVT